MSLPAGMKGEGSYPVPHNTALRCLRTVPSSPNTGITDPGQLPDGQSFRHFLERGLRRSVRAPHVVFVNGVKETLREVRPLSVEVRKDFSFQEHGERIGEQYGIRAQLRIYGKSWR